EPDPVAEERALGEGARGVDGDDADRRLALPHVAGERADQGRLAHARRPRDADDESRARLGVEDADELVRERIAVLDQRDRTSERAPVAAADTVGEIVQRPGATGAHASASSASS